MRANMALTVLDIHDVWSQNISALELHYTGRFHFMPRLRSWKNITQIKHNILVYNGIFPVGLGIDNRIL
jgi:hypothetical protein